MNMYNEALAMKDTLTADRRHFHQNPELGLDLPKTAAYVEEKLREMGYEPQRIGSGVVAVAGKKPGKCFLIRGDMDALPVTCLLYTSVRPTFGAASMAFFVKITAWNTTRSTAVPQASHMGRMFASCIASIRVPPLTDSVKFFKRMTQFY